MPSNSSVIDVIPSQLPSTDSLTDRKIASMLTDFIHSSHINVHNTSTRIVFSTFVDFLEHFYIVEHRFRLQSITSDVVSRMRTTMHPINSIFIPE